MGSILCEHCAAACCRYLALPIEKPKKERDYDDLRWYLMHEGVSLFVEEGSWYIQYQTTCKNLGADNLCTVYETRPAICGEYEPGSCDYSGATYDYDHLFTHAKQMEEHYFKKTGKRLGRPRPPERKKQAKPAKSKKSA